MSVAIDIPERIGRFHIRSVLGRGAMGVVYKGHDDHIDRMVAIKLIRADLLDSEERENYFNRFRNEAKIAGRCVHANIVGLYDFSFHDGNPYLVMEYVDGMGLQQALPRGTQRAEAEIIPIAMQVLDALHYAHERGIVHRDVKPANILLTPDSKLKITDFGISRLTSMELTMTPLLIGTPSYMSPEQCMGAALDGRSDLFSLGCVLYELLAGERPFTGVTYTDTILSIINRPHKSLATLRGDLSPALVAAVDCALAKKPEERFADAHAFSAALDQLAGPAYRIPPIPRGVTEIVKASLHEAPSEESQDDSYSGDDAATVLLGRQENVERPGPDPSAPIKAAPAVSALDTDTPATGMEDDDATRIVLPEDRAPAQETAAVPVNDTHVIDETVIASPGSGAILDDYPDALSGVLPVRESADGSAGTKTQPPFDAAAWRGWISSCLTRVIGPIAPIIITRVWDETHPEQLVPHCADFIQHADERAFFLRLVSENKAPDARPDRALAGRSTWA